MTDCDAARRHLLDIIRGRGAGFHTVVFRGEGLGWPVRGNASLGLLSATSAHSRGINTVLSRDGDLGYALVSDLASKELDLLANKITAH